APARKHPAGCHRDAPGADEPRRGNFRCRRRRTAIRHLQTSEQWRRRAHGRARNPAGESNRMNAVADTTTKPHRDTIFVEDAKVLAHQSFPGEQYILRVHAPKCAANALPGSFVHISCDPALPMRRPMSIMRVSR